MSDGWTIERLAPERDLDAVMAIDQASFGNPWTREMYVTELAHATMSHMFVIRTADAVVAGYCSFWLMFDELHINNLAVRPDLRRRGLGATLLRAILREAVGLGARCATLEVRRSNEAALRLYGRMGFVVSGTRPNYYANPTDDALILWREELGVVAPTGA